MFLLLSPTKLSFLSIDFSVIASFFAILLVILFFTKPRLIIKAERKNIHNSIHIIIRCTNKNFFRNSIKEVKCDVVTSDSFKFDEVCVMSLEKNWTAGIHHNESYTFINSKECLCDFDTVPYIRIKILTTNCIGLKKMHRRNYACSTYNLYEIKQRWRTKKKKMT